MIARERRSYYLEEHLRRNRIIAIVSGLLIHGLVVVGLFFYQQENAVTIGSNPEELNFGSSGGGGAENANKNDPVEFGAQRASQEVPEEIVNKATVHLLNIQIQREMQNVENAVPIPKKEKQKVVVAKKIKPRKTIIAENLPIGHVRHGGQGPGSGGGMGGGSGGGIGPRMGYAIDWGGTGSRRLLSGRIPRYPTGETDRQMAVVLQFTVRSDGSVDAIIPVRKTDEALERAATKALLTWRFDPLPQQLAQKSQTGKVTFNFKLEQ